MDVGHGQLHPKIRKDPRVIVYEKTHILKWNPPWESSQVSLHPTPNFFTIDVSFISLRRVLPRVIALVKKEKQAIEGLVLIKPQFEVGPQALKKGIVRAKEARSKAIQEILQLAKALQLKLIGHIPCPIRGSQGNQEEWMYVQ
jgi:23S rRNA (cytidine1920-2'-O)/16S rRNA (cytidine1409-2'-O)-methyltransferase